MPEWILWTLGLIIFLVVLAISVGLHEAGHMTVAKAFKLHVPKFFIGFGPKLFSFKKGPTEYGVRAIPLGGFVSIEDERFEEKSYERLALTRVAPWKRQLIFAAGPAVNIVLGVVIVLSTLMLTPYEKVSTTVDTVNACAEEGVPCGAAATELQKGDVVVAVDGTTVKEFPEIAPLLAGKESASITYLRDEKEHTEEVELLEGFMGITVATVPGYRSVADAWTFVVDIVDRNIRALSVLPEKVPGIVESIVTAERDPETPSSVVAVGKTYGDTTASVTTPLQEKISQLALYTGIFNLGLGIINLIPLLPLDGGRMLIAFMDSIRLAWSKVRKKTYEPTRQVVFTAMSAVSVIAVMGFMLLIIASDFRLIFAGAL